MQERKIIRRIFWGKRINEIKERCNKELYEFYKEPLKTKIVKFQIITCLRHTWRIVKGRADICFLNNRGRKRPEVIQLQSLVPIDLLGSVQYRDIELFRTNEPPCNRICSSSPYSIMCMTNKFIKVRAHDLVVNSLAMSNEQISLLGWASSSL